MKKPHEQGAGDLAQDLYNFVRTRILAESADFSLDTKLELVGIDSVSLLEILLYLERQHDIYIADEKLTPENISTLTQLAATAWASSRN
jgi:acyl carrier protein